jgi:hypothetical protein
MHLVYLATRSFWAPVAYHFLNNAGAVLFQSFNSNEDAAEVAAKAEIPVTADESTSLLVVVIAIACAISILALMWQMRVRYVLPNGETWNAGYVSVERPPASLNAIRKCGQADWGLTLVTVIAIAAFASTFWLDSIPD